MRSIFGKCIAIAMMAAIALVWQSPPAHADGLERCEETETMLGMLGQGC